MRRWLVFLIVGCTLVVLLPGTPIQLSYVYSDSMEPTIGEGDGYLVVPAGDVEPGDVVTFYSESRGEYVTHRVVEETEDGYVTQGDDNPSTDQAGGHPHVTDEAIAGKVLSIGGTPLVVPGLGRGVALLSTYWPLGVLAILLAASLLERNPRSRDLVRVRDLMLPLAATAILGTAAALVYSAPTYTISLIALETDDPAGRMIAVGEAATRSFDVAGGPAFTHQFVEGSGVTVLEVISKGDGYAIEVEVPPPAEAGGYEAAVTTYHYPVVLPYGVVAALHAIHPLVAAIASMATIVLPLYAVQWLATDDRALLETRSRRRSSWWDFK